MLTEIEGDLFDAPDGAVLIHSCNCMGNWGKGIARGFKEKYPAAFEIYRVHCKNHLTKREYATLSDRTVQLPEGTALVIPPQEKDYLPRQSRGRKRGQNAASVQTGSKKKHWIVCLFTSLRPGHNLSAPEIILENTRTALEDMERQLLTLRDSATGAGDANGSGDPTTIPGELWSCRFNSGLFGIDWRLSKQVLEDTDLDVTVVKPLT
ncbi:phosphatase, putative [Paecilomyces variotii No. 5]|uniref:Phosphatase, putative n=1 Tax=Byssochlamys spectabilis (strain No. 5 / NBRC 109023) TaxID=1356009 RepID=V5FIT9_BYSSN|nr:phosphatase, putative [Paecilomyces variotii No. 5]